MSKRPQTKNRAGKKAVQFFISPLSLARFNAAAALHGDDRNEAVERLFMDFADGRGIPADPTITHIDAAKPRPARKK